MWLALKILLSTALVLGLVKGLSVVLAKYGPIGLGGGPRAERRLRVLEATALPGGVSLYVVRYRDEEIVLASSKAGLTQITTEPAGCRQQGELPDE